MAELKEGDFVEINYNMYANGKLVQSTDEKLGKENQLNVDQYGPFVMILGKGFILKALDDEIIKSKGKENKLELENGFGRRDKNLIKTFPKSAFDEQQVRVVPGAVYDFNGMNGIVKSVLSGRVMVDFNNPLSGKSITLEYSDVKKVEDISKQISTILETVLRIPNTMFEISVKEKEVSLKIPEALLAMKEQLQKSFEELIPSIKEFKINFEEFSPKK